MIHTYGQNELSDEHLYEATTQFSDEEWEDNLNTSEALAILLQTSDVGIQHELPNEKPI